MTDLGKSRMFRAAIAAALTDERVKDPHTMAAVEVLAEGLKDIEYMLDYLWKYDEVFSSPYNSAMYIGCSRRKQEAVFIVTGKSWQDWLAM